MQLELSFSGTLTEGNKTIQVAKILLELLKKSIKITTKDLQELMTTAYGGSDAEGLWIWKDAYEALECACVLYIKYLYEIRAQAIYGDARDNLKFFTELESLLPTHTRRSADQLNYQQFSTPLPLSVLVMVAAEIKKEDIVLEPSAGNGLLGVWGDLWGKQLILNEIDDNRRNNLTKLFPDAKIFNHNAEQINDYLDLSITPSVCLINPPFSSALKIERRSPITTWKHITSALNRLQDGGRLVAITADWWSEDNPKWKEHFEALKDTSTTVFSIPIAGKYYYKHGTNMDTRLTVIDKVPDNGKRKRFIYSSDSEFKSLNDILSKILKHLPLRCELGSIDPVVTKQATKKTKAKAVELVKSIKEIIDWNNIVEVEYTAIEKLAQSEDLPEAIYSTYRPQRIAIKGAKEHPSPLVESAAMNSVLPPLPSYRPKLPKQVIEQGILSEPQLETVIYAGESHQKFLSYYYLVDNTLDSLLITSETTTDAVRFRRGYSLGDGTGVGKGRQVSGIILDNWLHGRKKALWISKNDTLLEDARRDFSALGGNKEQIVPLSKFKLGEPINLEEGVLFLTYSTLRQVEKGEKISRLQQVLNYLGKDFDGVIIFDESHAMANATSEKAARGIKAPSQQGLVGLRIQRALPNARVVYVSATGASKLENLSYMERLGLWGSDNVPFIDRDDFINHVSTGGVAAVEVVARDLKALGLYTARSLSFEGVEYQVLEHELTSHQIEVYNQYADAYKIIHTNIRDALKHINVNDQFGKVRNGRASSAVYAAFENAKQRFFSHVLSSLKSSTLIKAIEKDLENGYSAIIQVISTDEALLDRRLAEIPPSEWNDINVDVTPREYLFDYLYNAFPVHLHEVYSDENGRQYTRQALDENGNLVLSQSALKARDALIKELAYLPPIHSLLDQVIHYFGAKQVAEITGRTKRILREEDRLFIDKRPSNANIAETQAFQDDHKKILIFSNAGSTGRSYHAEMSAKNQRLRKHYICEFGWEAHVTVQGLGRTNRSNQKQPPIYILVTTDVKGEKRFTSSIAKRLDTLGAITKGERKTGGQGLFRESDNLESLYAKTALTNLYRTLNWGGLNCIKLKEFQDLTGLRLQTEDGIVLEEQPPMKTFLNRILATPIEFQNDIMSELQARIDTNIEQAIESGSYDIGVEVIRAHKMSVLDKIEIYKDKNSNAATYALKIERTNKVNFNTFEYAKDLVEGNQGGYIHNDTTKKVAVLLPTNSIVDKNGDNIERFKLVTPTWERKISQSEYRKTSWGGIGSINLFKDLWEKELSEKQEYKVDTFFVITGLLLPIWKKLDQSNLKVYRLNIGNSEQFLGRLIEPRVWEIISETFGVNYKLTGAEIYRIWQHPGSFTPISLTYAIKLKQSVVSGLKRMELIGNFTPKDYEKLEAIGCFLEIVQYRPRIFIPTTEACIPIIDKIRNNA